jgi:hypothetical protein
MKGVDNFCGRAGILLSWVDEDPTPVAGGTPGTPFHPC